MYLLHTVTESVLTEEQARALFSAEFSSIGFSPEGLEGLPLIILPDPNHLDHDPEYWYREVELVKDEGQYSLRYKKLPLFTNVDEALEKKINELNTACQYTIISNRFESEALGEVHTYGADQFDQANIQGNVLFALTCIVEGNTEMSCEHYAYNASNEKLLISHTPEQMILVGKDLRQHVLGNVLRCNVLKQSAKTYADAQDYESLVNVRW